jgi:hypothetical protein
MERTEILPKQKILLAELVAYSLLFIGAITLINSVLEESKR